MNRYASLFERLSGQVGRSHGASLKDCAMASVANHLANMLSTRAGSVQTLPDYGLPDLNDMRLSLHDALGQARYAIERFIESYEPRLNEVRVTPLPGENDPLKLRFRIEGVLQIQGFTGPASFSAALDGGAQVRVTPHVF